MSKEKLSSQEIVDLIASKALVSKRASEEFLKVMISTIEEALIAGETVKIKNFGTFKLHWNEPRKSVNVQTGEDIVLAGYYKVNFSPDNNLRDSVNEPFAHLEAVQLGGETPEPVEIPQKVLETMDPLRTLNEQASEIKDILAEIRNLNPKNQTAEIHEENIEIEVLDETAEEIPHQVLEERIQIPDYEFTDEVEIKEEKIPEVYPIEPEIELQNETEVEVPVSDVENTVEETNTEETFIPTFVPHNKKRKTGLWILIICIVVLAGTGTGLYCFYPPAKSLMISVGNNVSKSATDMYKSVSRMFVARPKKLDVPVTVVIPKDTSAVDTIEEEDIPPVDSLQLMFDSPRNYSEIIATETTHSGSRLTNFAKKYYGLKDFWVYIYEANREKVSDPDKIPSGTVIYIPKLDSRLIDKENQRCLDKAKELHDLYVKKTLKEE
ncbi:MAG: HU family DNA-binding protein [Paludibacter sp.]